MGKKTVGQAAIELQQHDEKINPIDLQRAIHKGNEEEDSFEEQVRQCIARGKKFIDDDFYIEVQFKKERLLQNVIRQYFIPKRACPTPQFDQVVYKYHAKSPRLEFLWVVPDWENLERLLQHAAYVPLEQQELVQMCRDFKSGKLLQKAQQLNNEQLQTSS